MNKKAMEYFSKEQVIAFVDTFEYQGYVIDGKEENGFSFSSTQIENMTSELYIALCNKYDIFGYDGLEVTSRFYPGYGSYYIAFDAERYTLNCARMFLDEHINSLQTKKGYTDRVYNNMENVKNTKCK